MPDKQENKLADSDGARKTIPDEVSTQERFSKTAGSVVDPAEVVPPVVPAQRTHKSWVKPLFILLAILVIIVIATVMQ